MGKPEFQLAWGYAKSFPIYTGEVLRGGTQNLPLYNSMCRVYTGEILCGGTQNLSHIYRRGFAWGYAKFLPA